MAVIYNTNYTHNSNSYLTLAVFWAAKKLWGEDNVVVVDNMDILSVAASGEHEVIICIDGQRTDYELMKRLRPCFKTMIFWAFEDPFMLDFNIQVTTIFDYVFTNDPICVKAYQTEAFYLPLAASDQIHYRKVKETDALDYDICFAGTMWPNRVDILRRVIIAFPQARYKLICPGNEYLPPLPADLSERVIHRPVSIEAFTDFANASKVTLTMFRNYASHGDIGQATAPGPRLYELGLAGTAQIVELPAGMNEKYLKEINGVAIAHNTEEIIKQIAEVIEKKNIRKKMAISSQQSVMKSHLYQNRLKVIEDVTQADFSLKKKEKKIIVESQFKKKLKVLFVTHSTIREQVWGGIEVYQQIISFGLVKDVEFYYWLRRRGACTLTDSNGQELERFDMPDVGWLDSMNDAGEETAFSNIINQYGFDVVHIQHLGHHTLSLPIIAKACGVGTVFSFHDFLAVCSHYNLLNYEQRYCRIEENKDVGTCDVCLKISEKLDFGVQQTRRAFVGKVMKSIDAFLYGTQHSFDVAKYIYPVVENKKNYILGIPSPDTTIPLIKKEFKPLEGRKLKVATVGNFIRSKGADTILSILQTANPNLYEFHIFGYMQPDYESVLKDLKLDNIILHGSYGLGEVSALQVADVALILSIWPETYCISLSEVWQNGLIPIVTDVGALKDRVQDGINGFTVPIGDVNLVIDRLELIRSDEILRQKLINNISPDLWVNSKEYAEKLLQVYDEVVPINMLGNSGLRWDIGRLHYIPHASWKEQAPPRHIFDAPTSSSLYIELPQEIEDWAVVQGAHFYIDDICYHILNVDDDSKFKEADEFHIRGWFIYPDMSNAGNLYTVLIHQDSDLTIFLKCDRESREDVASNFVNAPVRNGFSCKSALRGKWCEGRFRIGLINVVNGIAAFQLAGYEIKVNAGKVVKIYNEFHDNQVILDDFLRITEKDGIMRGIKLCDISENRLFHKNLGKLEYYIQNLSTDVNPENEKAGNLLKISGWAFDRTTSKAGQIYLAFVNESFKNCFFVATSRFIRHETISVFQNVPLNNGFYIQLDLQKGYSLKLEGKFQIFLINLIHNEFLVVPVNISVNFKNNQVSNIMDDIINEDTIDQYTDFLKRKLFRE